jgi:hypothetical protein
VQVALTELTERVRGFISSSAVRSKQATEHVSLELRNATNVKIRVIWMDYTGVPRQRHSLDIGPGRVRVTSTYEGHPWTSYTLDGERTQLLMNGSTVLWPRRERGTLTHVCEITAPTQEDDSSSQSPEPVSLSSSSSETSQSYNPYLSDAVVLFSAVFCVLFCVAFSYHRFVA